MAATCRQLAGRSPPSQLHTGRSPRPGANAPDGTILLFTPQTHHRQEIGHFLPHKHTVSQEIGHNFLSPTKQTPVGKKLKRLGLMEGTTKTQRQEEEI